jgi:hypothetical protein
MTFRIDFGKKETYDSTKTGITIETTLRFGNNEQTCAAKIDTGSEFCFFTRILADALEIDVESGHRENFSTLGGGIVGYAHEIELETLGLRFQSCVYFAESHAIKRNLLGRKGWLQLVMLGLNDYGSEIYLSPVEDYDF